LLPDIANQQPITVGAPLRALPIRIAIPCATILDYAFMTLWRKIYNILIYNKRKSLSAP
jgi:hypothetical protein